MAMRIVVEQIKTFSNKFEVWREGGTVGPMKAEMGAKKCNSLKEVLQEVRKLLPQIDPETEKSIDEAGEKFLSKYSNRSKKKEVK